MVQSSIGECRREIFAERRPELRQLAAEAVDAEINGSPSLARDLWRTAANEAAAVGLSVELEEFRSDAVAYLLPPSELSLEQLRLCWEESESVGALKRYVVLLHRFGKNSEVCRLIGEVVEGEGINFVDPELVLLWSLALPAGSEKADGHLREVILGNWPDGWRIGAVRVLLNRQDGDVDVEDLLRLLISAKEPEDGKLRGKFDLALLHLSLRCGDWGLAKAIVCRLIHSRYVEQTVKNSLLRIWLWLALERLPLNFEEISADIQQASYGDTLRREMFLLTASHYFDRGDNQLAKLFLDGIAADELAESGDEIVLRVQVAVANGQFAAAFDQIVKFCDTNSDRASKLIFAVNEQFIGSAMANRWNCWLADFFSKNENYFGETAVFQGKMTVAANYVTLGDANSAKKLLAELDQYVDRNGECAAKLQFIKLRLATALGDLPAANGVLRYMREKHGDSDEALESYFFFANYLSEIGRKAEAAEELCDFLRGHGDGPSAARAMLKLAKLRSELGDSSAAFSLLEKIVCRNENSGDSVRARLLEGDMLRESNDFAAAEAVYRSIQMQFPEDGNLPFAQLGLAKCLLASSSDGALEEAAELLEWLCADVIHNPNLVAETSYVLAMVFSRIGNDDKLKMLIEHAVEHENGGSRLDFCGRYWVDQLRLRR